MQLKGIIFDFDGLILDTETPDYIAWETVFRHYGAYLAFDEWAVGVGKKLEDFDILALLEAKVQKPLDRTQVMKMHHEIASQMIDKQPLQPGILDFICDARSKGIKLAVASSSDKKWVHGNLAKHNLTGYFDRIFTADDVSQAKPAPELYIKTLSALCLLPHEAIAIEDSPNGIRAAKAATLYCVAIPNHVTRKMDLKQADLILDTLENISLEGLLQRIGVAKNTFANG
ncbi:MAG: HAD-IA family hydrolase [Anaerolineae bacterium]|nr:HAD-IA family hydrolase [Anaerolineae bacterium]